MPFPANWKRNAEEILDLVDRLPDEAPISRPTIQALFECSARSAQRILQQVGPKQLGTSHLVYKQPLLDWVRRMSTADSTVREQCRVERLDSHLQNLKADLRARRIRIASNPAVKTLAGLPASIELTPASLTIRFRGMEDLLRNLAEFSQILSRDYEAVERLVSPAASPATPAAELPPGR